MSVCKMASNDMKDEDTICGIGRFKPKGLQRFASPKAYLVCYCILGVLQAAMFTYLVGIISTLEKRFSFESKISGIILIADSISPILVSTIIGYYGGTSHRPRLIFFGMNLVAFSTFLSALPYFLFGAGTHLLSRDSNMLNSPKLQFCGLNDSDKNCSKSEHSTAMPAVALLFLGNLINGFGATSYFTIGTSYLDDNVKKKNSPIYFSISFALRIFGPAFGFLLSSFSLRYYEDPFSDPGINQKDPRWIGAWWLGYVILGVLIIVFSIPMAFFPKRMPGEDLQAYLLMKQNKPPKIKDLPKAYLRLIKNPIVVCRFMSTILHINGFLGMYIFLPKYIESQFRQTASNANFYTGVTSSLTTLIGVVLGGVVVRRFQPRPKYLSGYMVFVFFLHILALLGIMLIGCAPAHFEANIVNKQLDLSTTCNDRCSCSTGAFHPICGPDGQTSYFSPCFAGCTRENEASNMYYNCSCMTSISPTKDATDGYCPNDCNSFKLYIIIFCLAQFVSSTARIGDMLITLRCVEVKDKSLAIGSMEALFCVLGYIPSTIIFGYLTDDTCIKWEEKCGERGNCWLYDNDKSRYYLHGISALLIALALFFDFAVFLMSGRLKNFYEDNDQEKGGKIPVENNIVCVYCIKTGNLEVIKNKEHLHEHSSRF